MKRLLPVTLILFVFLSAPPEAWGQRKKEKLKPSSNFTIEQLAPGVWAAIHNENYGKAICNAGIVDMGDKILIFDPFMTPSAAAELRDIARALTKKNQFYIVNSHHHTDHIRGNQAFLPNATIFSSKITRTHIELNEPSEQEWEKKHAPTLLQAIRKRMVNASESERAEMPYWIGYYEGIMESNEFLFTALPDYTFEDSLWLEGRDISVKLVECRNSHTASDAVLLIPSLGIAFMGDILSTDRHPWLSDGNVEGWKKALKVFYEDNKYHTYLPGHGKVSGKSALKVLYDYLVDVETKCNNATTDSAQAVLLNQPIPPQYRSWICGRFYQPNLQFLISTARERSQGRARNPYP
jgi:cyclase